jgi:hypothetical protein
VFSDSKPASHFPLQLQVRFAEFRREIPLFPQDYSIMEGEEEWNHKQ